MPVLIIKTNNLLYFSHTTGSHAKPQKLFLKNLFFINSTNRWPKKANSLPTVSQQLAAFSQLTDDQQLPDRWLTDGRQVFSGAVLHN